MAGVLNLLVWLVLIFFAGGSIVRLLNVRPRWLIVSGAVVALFFWILLIPSAWGAVTAAGNAVVLLLNLLAWTAGVYAGRRARTEAPPGHVSRVGTPR